MFITKTALSRRTVLRGLGATLSLPLLEAMMPVRGAEARQATKKLRFVAIEYLQKLFLLTHRAKLLPHCRARTLRCQPGQ